MSQISLRHIDKSYYEKDVLVDVELQVNAGDKIAIIGENGAGKSTLFRIILGKEKPDSENAEISISKNIIIGHLDQELSINPGENDALYDPEFYKLEKEITTLTHLFSQNQTDNNQNLLNKYEKAMAKFESLDGYNYRHKLKSILAGLGISEATSHRPLSELSGGERMRVALAKLLLKEPDVMLLDEPTNHLDHIAIEWLEDFLISTKSTVLVISHDRTFINRVANKTAEINHGELRVYPGNFSDYIRLNKERERFIKKEISKLENQVKRQDNITQTMLSHRKISSYRSSQKKSQKLESRLRALKEKKGKEATHLKINILKGVDLGDPNKVILEVKDLSVRFPDQEQALFSNFSFSLRAKEKVMIVGQNGCGKTTLINALLGQEENASGSVRLAKDIHYGVLRQLVDFPNEDHTVLESLQFVDPHLSEAEARNRLALFGFRSIAVFKKLNTLSGGERRRLYLCHLLVEKPDILFLDEPTNHLDINSCEILEKALINYEGAIMAVSHDRFFIEKIGDYMFGFVNQTISRYPNYRSFRVDEKNFDLKGKSLQRETSPKLLDLDTHQVVQTQAKMRETSSKENLFNNHELKLQKNLSEINQRPSNLAQARKFRAISDQAIQSLENKIKICETKKTNLEGNFSNAQSEEIYMEYHHLLELMEAYENLYLKLLELQENFA